MAGARRKMTSPDLIRQIEELSMNAFPPLHSVHDDGWVLHFDNDYARRVNAVYPLYAGSKALEEKIKNAEALYRAKGQPIIFKLTEASLPVSLDQTLAEAGYTTDTHAAVQLLDLRDWSGHPDAGVTLSQAPSEEWLATSWHIHQTRGEHRQTHEQILRRIIPDRRFASIHFNGQIVACGLGVLQNGFIGFYDIATDPTVRRQGYSFRLMQTLLAWAKTEGARHAYLQVMLNNLPALALYTKMGFEEIYRYWYRTKNE
jgi:GNAT superfamily N-acetyltransferase